MGEACLPSNDYFPWTPGCTQFIWGPYLSVWTFLILSVCISTLWVPEMRFWYVDLRLISLVDCVLTGLVDCVLTGLVDCVRTGHLLYCFETRCFGMISVWSGFCCPLTGSLDTIECVHGEHMPGWYFRYAWDQSEHVHLARAWSHISAWFGPFVVLTGMSIR